MTSEEHSFVFVHPESVRLAASDRLRRFIRNQFDGAGCRILSKGDKCECPLCDLDRVESVDPSEPRKPKGLVWEKSRFGQNNCHKATSVFGDFMACDDGWFCPDDATIRGTASFDESCKACESDYLRRVNELF